ncbi:hypothetical protein QM056_27400, partial [Klebsiella pneumoniae]
MTMPDILINTENIFLNRGICELLSEIAKEEHIREPYSVVDYFTDILGPIDMLFTEMAAGEHYLCHPFFKKLPPHTSIFIFVATDSALQVEQLPLCLGDATFISMNSDLRRVKNQIAKRLTESTTSREGANKQVISSQADSLIKISRIWADFFPANTSNQPI